MKRIVDIFLFFPISYNIDPLHQSQDCFKYFMCIGKKKIKNEETEAVKAP